MRDGIDISLRPPSVQREPPGPASTPRLESEDEPPRRASADDVAATSSTGTIWVPLLLWIGLAVGALLGHLRYTSQAVPDGVLSPGRGPFESIGAFGLALGVVGCAMIVTGVLIYAFRKQDESVARSTFTVHAFLCSLGGFYVVLSDGIAFAGPGAVSTWAVLAVLVSLCAGGYLIAWLPGSTHGRGVDMEQLARRRQRLLQRLWTMTDVAPERLEALLGREVPVGEVGSFRALKASLRFRFRPVWRKRRFDAAVAILGVPAAAAPEALRMVAEQSRIQAVLRLGKPLHPLLNGWRRIHVPVGLAASMLVAARLVLVAMGQAS